MVYAERTGNENLGIVYVPSSAVLNTEGNTKVFVYSEDSGHVKARAVTVTSVKRDGTIQIGSGLKPGESIVVSGVHHIQDGQKVRKLEKPVSSNVGGLL